VLVGRDRIQIIYCWYFTSDHSSTAWDFMLSLIHLLGSVLRNVSVNDISKERMNKEAPPIYHISLPFQFFPTKNTIAFFEGFSVFLFCFLKVFWEITISSGKK
jgi:hypothetical protein